MQLKNIHFQTKTKNDEHSGALYRLILFQNFEDFLIEITNEIRLKYYTQ